MLLYTWVKILHLLKIWPKVDNHIKEDGKPHHTAIRYGVTQACLHAVALSKSKVMAQIIAEEYGTEISSSIIPIFLNLETTDIRMPINDYERG